MNTRLIKCILFCFVLAFAGRSFGYVTNEWNNATGDCKWSTAGNWSLGVVPNAGDVVACVAQSDDKPINVDMAGVSIRCFTFTGDGQIVFEGQPIKLTGRYVTGSYAESHDYTIRIYGSATQVLFRNEIEFAPTDSQCGVWLSSKADLTFAAAVTVTGDNKILYLHNSPSNTDATSRGSSSKIYFLSSLTGLGATYRPQQAYSNYIYFYGPVKLKAFYNGSSSVNPWMFLYSKDNEFTNPSILLNHSDSLVYAGTEGAFPTNLVLSWPNDGSIGGGTANYTSYYTTYNLGNFNQTVDRIAGARTETVAGYTYGVAIHSSAAAASADVVLPVTLTLRGTQDAETYAIVEDSISVVWDPVDDFTQTFSARASRTCGSLVVRRGTLRLAGTSKFANAQAVRVAAGATFDLQSTQASALKSVRRIELEGEGAVFQVADTATTPFSDGNAVARIATGAKFALPAGAAISLAAVTYGETVVANDTYTGGETTDAAKHADWIDGDGTVTVTASARVALWTGAASGAWEIADNWASGQRPVDGTTTHVFLTKATDEDVVITVNEAIASFPGDLVVRNGGAGTTVLKFAADATAGVSGVLVENGGRIEVGDGATFLSNGDTGFALANRRFFRLVDGGEWRTTGTGKTRILHSGGIIAESSGSVTSRWSAVSGGTLEMRVSTTYPFALRTGSSLTVTNRGTFYFPHYTWNHITGLRLQNGTMDFNDGTFTIEPELTQGGGSISYGTGTYTLAGDSTNVFNGISRSLVPNAPGEVSRLVVKDRATFKEKDGGQAMTIGGGAGGLSILDYDCPGKKSASLFFAVGYEAGMGELNVRAGTVSGHQYGLQVGYNGSFERGGVDGLVRVFDGATLSVYGSTDNWACGTSDGHYGSTFVGYRSGSVCGRPSRGTMLVEGSYSQSYGNMLIGVGSAMGTFVQNGGTSSSPNDSGTATVIGAAGGIGLLVVSNGTFTARNTLYVGGCDVDEMPGTAKWVSVGKYPADRHDAAGTVRVVGGTLATGNYSVIVGADGSGTLEMVGSAGALTAKTIVLSNATESVASFVADASGFSPMTATNLKIAEGAKLKVDLSGYTGTKTKFPIFASTTVEGEFADIEVFGGTGKASDYRVVRTATGLSFAQQKGLLLILR